MLEVLKSLLSSQSSLLWVALVSAIVSAGVSYWFRKRELWYRLKTEYEHEQRKKIRDLLGAHYGRVLNAADRMNLRFFDLYQNATEGWLRPNLNDGGSYFYTSVYRFMNVCSVIRQFERESLHVDDRIAEKLDFLFIRYLDALRLCVTDAGLFHGLPVASYYDTHHIYADPFRQDCDSCIDTNGDFLSYVDFVTRVRTDDSSLEKYEFSLREDKSLKSVLKLFYLCAPDQLKWDRLVVFHLLLVGLINTFGYAEQEEPKERIDEILSQIQHEEVLINLRDWLARRGLSQNQHEGVLRNLRDWLPRRRLARAPLTKMITRFIAAKHPTLLEKT